MALTWNDLICTPDKDAIDALAESWAWRIGDGYTPLLFTALGDLFYEAAVVSLDLAGIYVRLGAAPKLERTITETVPIFRSLGVDREALAALIQLRSLADHEKRALELIQGLSCRLESLADRTAPN